VTQNFHTGSDSYFLVAYVPLLIRHMAMAFCGSALALICGYVDMWLGDIPS